MNNKRMDKDSWTANANHYGKQDKRRAAKPPLPFHWWYEPH